MLRYNPKNPKLCWQTELFCAETNFFLSYYLTSHFKKIKYGAGPKGVGNTPKNEPHFPFAGFFRRHWGKEAFPECGKILGLVFLAGGVVLHLKLGGPRV